jgi:Spondin_N
MSSIRKLLAGAGTLAALTLTVVAPAGYGSGDDVDTYRVTLQNLTAGQPFSPPVAATHRRSLRMFRVGGFASDELAAIAQGGNQIPMFNLFNGSPRVTQTVDIGMPVMTKGKVVGSFTDTVTFEISARESDRLSLATMLICTNDGFLGLDSVRLPDDESKTFMLNGYDAGRENNTEISPHIVDPCSELGPTPLPGDPDGNLETGPGVSTEPPERIRHHRNIRGVGELSVSMHAWTDPVAKVTVESLDDDDDEDDD